MSLTARRRQRVIKALNEAATRGEDLSITAIARTAGVHRTFLYRHRDLLAQVHLTAAQPATGTSTSTSSSVDEGPRAAAHPSSSRAARWSTSAWWRHSP